MYLGRTKIFIITFLVFLAVYQTANLWFEGFSNHSFFYSLNSKPIKLASQNEVDYNLKSIIINLGNNKFIQNFNDISKSSYKQVFDEAISLAIKSGKFSQTEEFDINLFLDNKGIIYNYSYSIDGSEISTIFNTKNKNLYKIEKFDLISILPNFKKTDQMNIIFFDTVDLKQYEFLVNKSSGETISNLINKFYLGIEESYYLSSVKSGFDLFEKNQFILNWDESHLKYNKINVVNPLEKSDSISVKTLENYINIFFENPAVKWYLSTDEVITYSDESTVVKYYENGVLEYSNYKSGENQSNKKIFELYITAINFLNKDINIKNEYYLKKYIKDEDKVTFYFDYKINNFPINLSSEEKEKTSMESMIEVTVSQSKVSKYKRIVYDFYTDEKISFFYKDFLSAIDNIIYKNYNNKDGYSIKNIELAYNFKDLKKNNNQLSIGWFIEIDDKSFFEN